MSKRRWKIKMRFGSGLTHLASFDLIDISEFITHTKNDNDGVKIHDTLPLDLWLIDMVFDKATQVCPDTDLIDATIS